MPIIHPSWSTSSATLPNTDHHCPKNSIPHFLFHHILHLSLSLSYRSYRSIHSRSHTIVCHAICFIYLEFWPRICVWCIDMRCVYFVIYRYFMFTVKFGIFFRLLIISTSEPPDISSIHHMELIKLNIWDYWVVCA